MVNDGIGASNILKTYSTVESLHALLHVGSGEAKFLVLNSTKKDLLTGPFHPIFKTTCFFSFMHLFYREIKYFEGA